MIKLLAKWTLLVCLNAAISFYFAMSEHRLPFEILAMAAGVVTFIGIYMTLEHKALQKNKRSFARRLTIAASLKICTQFFPVLEMWAGFGASVAISLVIPERGFFQVYFITILDGILLSIVVGVLMGLVFLAEKLYRIHQTSKKAF